MPLLLFSIFWMGQALGAIGDEASGLLISRFPRAASAPLKTSRFVSVMLLLVVTGTVLPKTLKPQRYERLSEKAAGVWLKSRVEKEATIFTTASRVGYYANAKAETVDFKKDRLEGIRASMMGKGAVFLVLRGQDLIDFPGEAASIRRKFVEETRYDAKGMETIIVYRMVPAAREAPGDRPSPKREGGPIDFSSLFFRYAFASPFFPGPGSIC